jgi:hypothetical protein
VLDVIRGKFPFNKLVDKIIEVKERYGKTAALVEQLPCLRKRTVRFAACGKLRPGPECRLFLAFQANFEGPHGFIFLPMDLCVSNGWRGHNSLTGLNGRLPTLS